MVSLERFHSYLSESILSLLKRYFCIHKNKFVGEKIWFFRIFVFNIVTAISYILMIALERAHQDLSEKILALLAPCEIIVKFRHTFAFIFTYGLNVYRSNVSWLWKHVSLILVCWDPKFRAGSKILIL